jgi:hypothetical protein
MRAASPQDSAPSADQKKPSTRSDAQSRGRSVVARPTMTWSRTSPEPHQPRRRRSPHQRRQQPLIRRTFPRLHDNRFLNKFPCGYTTPGSVAEQRGQTFLAGCPCRVGIPLILPAITPAAFAEPRARSDTIRWGNGRFLLGDVVETGMKFQQYGTDPVATVDRRWCP